MCVPAHDQRDFEFARHYGLPVKVVIQPPGETLNADTMTEAFVDDGVMVNFPFTISRDMEYVAKVTVVEVHDTLCVAHVVQGFEEKPIQVGYDASTRR